MLDFQTFVESLEHVPPEFERNFNLIRDLDSRSNELIGHINDLVRKYKATRNVQERREIKAEIDTSMDKMTSYAHDKIELATQTYDIVDKNIKALLVLNQPPEGEDACSTNAKNLNDLPPAPPVPPGYDMPVDDFEPKYCYCRVVSFGEMIACENPECLIEWFHLPCVGLQKAPKGKWFCKECLAERTKVKKETPNRRKNAKR